MKGAQADSLYSSASLFTKLFPPAQCRQKTKVLCAHWEPDVLTLTVLTRREGQCQLPRQAVPAPPEDKMFSQDHPHSQSQGQALIQGSWTPRSYPFLSREPRWEVYSPPGWRVPREAGAQTNDPSKRQAQCGVLVGSFLQASGARGFPPASWLPCSRSGITPPYKTGPGSPLCTLTVCPLRAPHTLTSDNSRGLHTSQSEPSSGTSTLHPDLRCT